ncbi:MAG: hypothetical protein NC209_04945 [Alistipes sp.]|nr:hypothetical protein [Alistipes senegalensis]MCM1250470.1 hypothetical protein [Alistipes sp.]
MKKLFNYAAAALLVAFGAACSDDEGSELTLDDAREAALKNVAADFVGKTVIPTYRSLADAGMELQASCEAILGAYDEGSLTDELIRKAGDDWKNARRYWEWSEAFLFGAATDYNIDPHIDSWPLDVNALQSMVLGNAQTMAAIERNPDFVATLGFGLLGFHALEYMLFAEGGARAAATLDRPQLVYLVGVANDLCNQCVRLEAAWCGGIDEVSEEKRTLLEDAELDEVADYGGYMIDAGQSGSIYKTYADVGEEILQGCIDIATEVGSQKIGRPANGTSEEDINYIESPHSYNSRQDFVDNIVSIRNAYEGSSEGDAAVGDYLRSVNPTLDAEVREAIAGAIAKIEACPAPFVNTRTDPRWKEAAEYCNVDLVLALTKAQAELTK